MAGTYEFDESTCSEKGASALCISRTVTIEAEVAGTVVLDAKRARRVIYVSSSGRAELIGLNITGGVTDEVCVRNFEPKRMNAWGSTYICRGILEPKRAQCPKRNVPSPHWCADRDHVCLWQGVSFPANRTYA